MSRMHGVLPPPLWGRAGERASRGGDVAVVKKPGTSARLRENPRVAPPSLTSRASFARLGPHEGGGNGETLPCVVQMAGAVR